MTQDEDQMRRTMEAIAKETINDPAYNCVGGGTPKNCQGSGISTDCRSRQSPTDYVFSNLQERIDARNQRVCCGKPDTCINTKPCLEREKSREAARVVDAIKSGSGASSILKEATSIVVGARNSTHGDKERSFQVIANLWNAYLEGRKVQGPITPFDVAQFMVLLKIGRSIQGTMVRDHAVDACGYSAIAGELAGVA